jgi:hypothetical protein
MNQQIFLFITFLALAGCSADDTTTILTLEGYGDVRFGAPLAEAEAKLLQVAEPPVRNEGCSYVTFGQYPDIRFMIENGIVTRADAGASIANSSGFSVGNSSAELQSASPQIKVMPHKYEPQSHYLVLPSTDGMSALVFEESGGLITKVRAGVEPSVEYVEGCG